MNRKMIAVVVLATFCLISPTLLAQNTIGGVNTTVPEAEVKRQSQFLTAERERLLNNHEKALELYKKFTYDNPDIDAGWYGLARCHAAMQDFPNAVAAISKASTMAPENRWYSIFQADLFEKLGRLTEAIGVYESLVKRFPQTPEFYERLAYLHLQNEDPKRALKVLDKWEALVGLNEAIAYKKHVIYVGLGDVKKAAAEYKRLSDAYPKELRHLHRLAEFYTQIGDQTNARTVFEDILRRSPNDPVARMALAGNQANSDAAKLAAMRPLFQDTNVPIDEKVKAVMPYLQKMSGNQDQAMTRELLDLGLLLEKAHPDDAKAWSLSGDLFFHADRNEDALERYRKCIGLNPTVFAVWDNTLTLLAAQKHFDELLSTADQAIDAFPNQPKAYYFYGMAANLKTRYNDALPQLEQGLLMAVSNSNLRLDIADQIGLALMGKKDFAEAIARYEQILSKGGDQHPGILEHLGDAYSLQGKGAQAVEFWKKANLIRRSPGLEQKIAAGKI